MMIRLVPTDGRRSVQFSAVTNAWSGLINYLTLLQDLKLTVGDDLDHGWHGLPCPSCGAAVDLYWFAEVVEAQAVFMHVSRLVVMPCCRADISVNALCEQEKERLAGFVLSFRSQGRDMDAKVIHKLEQVLDCPLTIYFDMENSN
ncbi:MAG: hypothetical protein ACYDCO_11990 [Armatimonadota bacterium]